MATARKWSNIAIAMESARAAAKTITAITKANPASCTSTSHGYATGDFVVLTIQGMFQLNARCARIVVVDANTFTIEGVDSTNFDTFVSGTAEKITFGTSISTATSVSSSGGGFDFIDTTTIHSNVKTQIPGLPNAATYSFDNVWDVSDAGLAALKTASDAQAQKAMKFTFGTGGQIMSFLGYVGANLLPGGQTQGLVTCTTTMTLNGQPNYYAS